ncbi:sulfite exporter TauE/SafE family protein [Herbaspirillum sp. RV1423]|uniref:sulfite exporter TauE/SafE family protein n=1 Tax=Herbaspirillum sp. RV1423 TaxID=1443993 RepID=UPI000550B9C2|nr:sulfite exporter TauE/SafE family protein [Herbaspirillum sp. RV1423]
MEFYLSLAACGCIAGVTTVLFGFGGGFVVVPLLYQSISHLSEPGTLAAQSAMHVAVATSTCVMIFGSLVATRRHHRAGSLDWSHIRPMLPFIACGAMLGALTATALQGVWLRWAFAAFLAFTILDCLLRPGFLNQTGSGQYRLTLGATALAGLIVGWVAALLGVGGSVMTVPLLRRQGISMTGATAMANPLSLPVALAGSATYVGMALAGMPSQGDWHVGYVDLRAWAVLVLGSWAGIHLASPWIGRIPDRVHATVYLGLLTVVLAAMVWPTSF